MDMEKLDSQDDNSRKLEGFRVKNEPHVEKFCWTVDLSSWRFCLQG